MNSALDTSTLSISSFDSDIPFNNTINNKYNSNDKIPGISKDEIRPFYPSNKSINTSINNKISDLTNNFSRSQQLYPYISSYQVFNADKASKSGSKNITKNSSYTKNKFVRNTKNSPIRNTKNSSYTKNKFVRNTKNSPVRNTKNSPIRNTKNSPIKNTKNSPIGNTKNSPTRNTKNSPIRNTKNSPIRNTKNSPVRNTKNSIVVNTKNSPVRNTKNTSVRNTKNSPVRNTKNSPIESNNKKPILKYYVSQNNNSETDDRINSLLVGKFGTNGDGYLPNRVHINIDKTDGVYDAARQIYKPLDFYSYRDRYGTNEMGSSVNLEYKSKIPAQRKFNEITFYERPVDKLELYSDNDVDDLFNE